MKRSSLLIVLLLAVISLMMVVSCAGTAEATEAVVQKSGKGTAESPFVKQFLDAGASVQIDEGFISLKQDFHIPEGKSLVLNTGETWNLNLNGHTIFQSKGGGKPAIVIESGSLAVVTGKSDKYQGGVFCADGLCFRVQKGGKLDIQAGTISSNADYAIEVMQDGNLIVRDGKISAQKLPLLVHFGWSGKLNGGLFSAYDDAYSQAILGMNFASTRLLPYDRDFAQKWTKGFRVVQGHKYEGLAYLKISSTGGLSATFRLYKEQDLDDVMREDEPVAEYEWFMYPGQVHTVALTSGSYVLKVAEGEGDWSDEKAFGKEGVYWSMDPFYFADGNIYSIDRSNGTADTWERFLNP